MDTPSVSAASPKVLSHVLFAAVIPAAMFFHLGPAILAGLFSYTILDVAYRKSAAWMRPAYARWLALAVFMLAAVAVCAFLGKLVQQSLSTVPAMLSKVAPVVTQIGARYGIEVPVDSVEELRGAIVDLLRDNAKEVTRASRLFTEGFFQVVIAIVLAVLAFMTDGRRPGADSLYGALRAELAGRLRTFMQCFELVLGAQVAISAINTTLTAVFLLALSFPYAAFLIPATFVFGMLPIIGNILSNTVILGAALTISPHHAALALVFLVLIHKGEYFLNSRIVGSSIEAPMWETLFAIFIGELLLGVPGIILAPAVQRYLRVELEGIPLRASGTTAGPRPAAPAA